MKATWRGSEDFAATAERVGGSRGSMRRPSRIWFRGFGPGLLAWAENLVWKLLLPSDARWKVEIEGFTATAATVMECYF
jgi:hypothetical protein